MTAPLYPVEHELLALRDRERFVLLDDAGHVSFSKFGARDEVRFDAAELTLFRGATATHNHPQGAALSCADMLVAVHTHLAEIRAVGATPYGAAFLYRLRPMGRWPRGMYIADAYWAAVNDMRMTGQQYIDYYSVPDAKRNATMLANAWLAHAAALLTARRLGMSYQRQPISLPPELTRMPEYAMACEALPYYGTHCSNP